MFTNLNRGATLSMGAMESGHTWRGSYKPMEVVLKTKIKVIVIAMILKK